MIMFINLVDCIDKSRTYGAYILYVGVLFFVSMILLIFKSKWSIVFVLALVGMLTILDVPTPNYLSAGVIFFMFSIRLANNIIYSICIYFLTFICVIGSHVIGSKSPLDAVNVLLAYSIIYLIDYFMYNKKERCVI